LKKNTVGKLIFLFTVCAVYFIKITILNAAEAAIVQTPYVYYFNNPGTVIESSNSSISTSPYWWLSSGGYMNIFNSHGHSSQGELPATDPWRVLYAKNNPTDTDNGYHPQNIFRFVTRSKWQNAEQEVYFKITKDNLSQSSNRNASNGLLLFNRYNDQDNLYYTGIRVDGAAVIKKKINGTYYTLSYVKGIYGGTYNRDTKPNLLPKNAWIGLRSQVKNNPDGTVSIKVYLDKNWNGNWQLIASATDYLKKYGPVISTPGYG
jgi:hypothetical protein